MKVCKIAAGLLLVAIALAAACAESDSVRPWTLHTDSHQLDADLVRTFAILSKSSSGGGIADQNGYTPAVLNLECADEGKYGVYWLVQIDWHGEISTSTSDDTEQIAILAQFDGGDYRVEDWRKPDAHYDYLRAPYGSHSAYILEFLQHRTFRLELQDGGATTIWNEWDLRGLDDWINHPDDLCTIAEISPPQTPDATPAP